MNDEGYEFNDDPAPDLVEITPDGGMIVVAFRGSTPITVKHAALGSCPGFGVVTLSGDGGSTGALTHVFRTFLADATRHQEPERHPRGGCPNQIKGLALRGKCNIRLLARRSCA